MSEKQPWKKNYTGYATNNQGVQVYVEKGKIKPVGTQPLRILKGGLDIVKKGVDFLSIPPSVRKARKEGTAKPLTYRETLPGQMQTLGELTISGVSNIAKNVIDRNTKAPGPITKDVRQPSVFDVKQDLKIKKEQKTAELEAKYGGK